MVLIQLLLPAPRRDAASDPRLRETRRELFARYGGATAYFRAPADGDWMSPDGSPERDTVVMVEVVTQVFDREWWRQYERTLAARFDQDIVHIRAIPVDMLDDQAR